MQASCNVSTTRPILGPQEITRRLTSLEEAARHRWSANRRIFCNNPLTWCKWTCPSSSESRKRGEGEKPGRGGETHIGHPLQPSQGANHEDAHGQPVPETGEANVLVNACQGGAKGLTGGAGGVELADHDVGGVGDDSAQDAGEVASGEGDARLGRLAVVALAPGEAVVHHLDDGLEGGELHHGVGDLAAPQRVDAFVQAGDALLAEHGADTVEGAPVGARDAALHAHLDGLKGAERHVGEHLGRGGRNQVQAGPVLDGRLGAGHVRVRLLEELVEAVLGGALSRVADQGGAPAGEDAAHALGAEDLAPGLDVAGVEFGVDLAAGLDQVERSYRGVGESLLAGWWW